MKQSGSTFGIEALEQRILLSADPIGGVFEDAFGPKEPEAHLVVEQRLAVEESTFGIGFSDDSAIWAGAAMVEDRPSEEARGAIHAAVEDTVEGATFQIRGTEDGAGYTSLSFDGTVLLSGVLKIQLLDGFVPEEGDTFTLVSAATINGAFTDATGLFGFGGGLYFFLEQDGATLKMTVKSLSLAADLAFVSDLLAVNDPIGLILNAPYFGSPVGAISVDAAIEAGPLSLAGTFSINLNAGDLVVTGSGLDFTFAMGDVAVGATDLAFGLRVSPGAGYALAANGSAAVSGFEGVTLSGDLTIELNRADTSVVDFGDYGVVDFGGTDPATRVGGDNLVLGLDGFAALSGGFAFEHVAGEDGAEILVNGTGITVEADRASASGAALGLSGANVDLLLKADGTFALVTTDATVSVNELGALGFTGTLNLAVNNTGAAEVDFGGEAPYDFGTDAPTYAFAGDDIELTVADFFSVSGSIAFRPVALEGMLSGEGGAVSLEGFVFGGSALAGFAGLNGGTEDAVGLSLSGISFGLAFLTEVNGTNAWFSLQGSAEEAALSGFESVLLSATDLTLAINTFDAGNAVTEVIDYADGATELEIATGSESLLSLDMAGTLGPLSGLAGSFELLFADYFKAAGTMAFSRYSASVKLSDDADVDVDVLAIGGLGLEAFAGINASRADRVGFQLGGVDFALALLEEVDGDGRSWASLQGSAAVVGLIGIDGLALSGSDLGLEVNVAASDSTVVDYSETTLEMGVAIDSEDAVTLSMDGAEGEVFRVSGTLTLDLSGFFIVEGAFAIERLTDTVTLDDDSQAEVDVIAFGGSGLSAFAGVEGTGFSLEGVSFGVFAGIDKDDPKRQWIGLEAMVGSAGLAGMDGVTATLSNVSVQANLPGYDGTLVDFEAAPVDVPVDSVGTVVTLALAAAEGELLKVLATLELNFYDFFQVAGSFAVQKNRTFIKIGEDEDVEVDALAFGATGVSAFAGMNGSDADNRVGFALENASFAVLFATEVEGDGIFTAVEASVEGASLTGVEGVTLAGTDISVRINRSNDDRHADFSSAEFSIPVGPDESYVFTMDAAEGELTEVSGSFDVDVMGFVSLSGDLAVRRAVTSVQLFEGTEETPVNALTIGASDVTLFAGYGSGGQSPVGLSVTVETFAMALLSQESDAALSYLALTATGGAASLVGFEGIEASVAPVLVELNLPADDGSLVDFATLPLEIALGPEATESLELDGSLGGLARFGGEMVLDVGGFVRVEGSFFFNASVDSVSVSNEGVIESDIAVQKLTIGATGVEAFVGVSAGTEAAVGLGVGDLTFGLAVLKEDVDEGRQWISLTGSFASAGLVGVESVVASVSNASLSVNLAATDGSVADFSEAPLELETGLETTVSLEFDGARGEVVEVSGAMELRVADFVSISGALALIKDSGTVTLSDGTSPSVERLLIGGSGLEAFAGANAGTVDAVGFGLSGMQFALALQSTADGTVFTSLEANVDSVGLVGVVPVVLSGTDLAVRVNLASEGDLVVDYADGATQLSVPTGPDESIAFTLEGGDGAQVGAVGTLTLDIAGFVSVGGSFSVEQKTSQVRVTGESVNREVGLLSIGAESVSAFIGANGGTADATGLQLTDLTFALGVFTDVEASQRWVAVSGSATSVGLIGIPDLTLAAQTMALEVNMSSDDGSVLDFASQSVELATGPDSTKTLQHDGEAGELVRASGEVEISVGGFVQVSGAIGVETGNRSVRVTDADSDILASALIFSAASVNGFAGSNGGTDEAVGVAIEDVALTLAILTDSEDPAQTWVAVQGSIGSASIVGVNDSITLKVLDLAVEVNLAAEDGSVLDFATTPLELSISETLTTTLDFSGEEGEIAKVRGGVAISVADFFAVSGEFSIESRSGQVRVAGDEEDTDADLLTISASGVGAFAGLNAGAPEAIGLELSGVEFAVVLVSEVGGANRGWATVMATAGSVSFAGLGDDLSISGSVSVSVNLAAEDGSVLDYATTSLSVSTGVSEVLEVDIDGSLGELLEVSGSLDLSLFGYFGLNGEFAFKRAESEVQLAGEDSPTAVDVLTLAGSGLSLFAGVDGGSDAAVGLQLSGVSFALAILTDSDTGEQSWTALSGTADSFALVGVDGLTLESTELQLSANLASEDGSLIDFASSPLQVDVGESAIAIDLDGADGETVQISGALNMEVLGIALTGKFAFIKTTTSLGREILAFVVEDVSIGSYSGEGTEGATISIADAKGLLVVADSGIAGSLSFKASVGFGPFEAGASVFLRMNSTGEKFYFNTPFGEVGLAEGVYTKLDFAELSIRIPGVEIEGDFTVMSDSTDGGQIIAGNELYVFVGTSDLDRKIGLQLENGTGLFYTRGEKTAAILTGTVTLYGVPGLVLTAEMTVTLNGFREDINVEADVNGEGVVLTLGEDQYAAPSGEAFIQFSATGINLTLLNSFMLEGDLTFTRSGDDLLIGSSALSLFAGTAGEAEEERVGLALVDIEMAAFIPTQASGFAISMTGVPQIVGIEGVDFGDSIVLGFRYNSTGDDVAVSVPSVANPIDLSLAASDSDPLFFGSAALNLGGFVEVSGSFAIQYKSLPEEHLIIGFAAVEIFVGSGGADRIGILAEVDSLAVYVDLTSTGGFALSANGSLGLVGLDGLSIGGTAEVSINTTGKPVNASIVVPGLSGNSPQSTDGPVARVDSAAVSVVFPDGEQVVRFGGSLSLSIPGLLDINGTASIERSPAGRVDIALTETSLSVSAFDSELFSLSGEAFFSIDPVSGFSMEDFYLNGFSVLGLAGGEIPSVATIYAPTAELVSPVAGESLLLSDLVSQGTIDVYFAVRGSAGIDAQSILDEAAEFVLYSGGGEVAVSGLPELVGVNTYRYTIDEAVLVALQVTGFEEWSVRFVEGSFLSDSGVANEADEQVFYVTNGAAGTTAALEGSAGSGTVDAVLLNGSASLEVRFTDHGGNGIDLATILDAGQEFTLSGAGVLDAGATGALSGVPVDLGDGLFRYMITDLTPDDGVGLFGEGEVVVSFISGSWESASGVTGLAGEAQFEVLADSAATAEPAEPITLGPLSLVGPSIGLEDLAFVDGKLSVTLAIGAESIDLGFGDGAVTTSVKDITGTFDLLIDALGFLEGAGSIVPSGKWSLSVGEIELAVDGIIEARAAGVAVGYDPNYNPEEDTENERAAITGQTLVVIDEIAVTIPIIGLTGSVSSYDPDGAGPQEEIPGLVIWENGFRIGTAMLTYGVNAAEAKASDTRAARAEGGDGKIGISGIIEFDDIRVGITNFEVISGQDFSFDGDIFIASGGASFFPGSPVSATFRDRTSGTALSGKSEAEDTEAVRAVLQFTDGTPSGFVFYADTMQITFGSVVQVFAEDLYINTAAGPNEEVVSFASVGASLNVGPLAIKGEARNFAFLGDGSFVTKEGFGVFFGGSEDGSSALGLPSWLPLYIDFIGVEWENINANPADFVLTLSGGVREIEGIPGAKFSGSVEGLKIDVGLLLEGKFPIVDLGAFTVGIEANVFGGQLSGTLVAGLLKIGTDGEMVPVNAPANTEVVDRVLFIGIQGGFEMSGLALTIRFAVSELGPLGVVVGISIPGGILIDPTGSTGLSMNDFVGGVEFYKSLPDLTDAKQLRDPSLRISTPPDPDKWLDAIKQQVVLQWQTVQANPGLGGFFGAFTQPMIISGSAKIFTMYASQQTFNGQVEVQISTDGKILVIGTLNFLDDNVSISAALYANLSKLLEGKGTFLFLATVPDQVDILEIGGEFSFGFTGPGGEPVTLPAFVLTDEGVVPVEVSPRAALTSPADGGSAGIIEMGELRTLAVTFLPGTGAEVDLSTLNDADTVFTLSGPNGTWDIAGPGSADGSTVTYALPESVDFVAGDYTVTFAAGTYKDTAGRDNEASTATFTIRAVYASIVNFRDGGRMSYSEAKAIGSLDFFVGPTRGSTIEESSLMDSAVEWVIEGPNGAQYPLTAKPVSLGGGQYGVSLPAGLVWTPGEWRFVLQAGTLDDSGGFTNAASTTTLLVEGAEAYVSFEEGGIAATTLNARGYIDVRYFGADGAAMDIASVLDGAPEFSLSGTAAGDVAIADDQVLSIGNGLFRYPFTGAFVPGELAITFAASSWADINGVTNFERVTIPEVVELGGTLVEPRAFDIAERSAINSRQYILVAFDDPLGVGMNEASITDNGLEFRLSGEGVGTAVLSGAATKVVEDGKVFWKYPFSGRFEEGLINIDFLEGNWSDNNGNLGSGSTEVISIYRQSSSFFISLGGFVELEAGGLTPDYDGNGEPDPLLKMEGEVRLTFEEVLDENTLETTGLLLNLQVSATLEMFYLGNIGSAAANLTVGFGDVNAGGGLFGENTIAIWGAIKIQSNLGFLENIGIKANAELMLYVNSTNTDRNEVLVLEGIKGDEVFTFTDAGIVGSLPATASPDDYAKAISDDLRTLFEAEGLFLTDSLTVQGVVNGQQWRIIDNGDKQKMYFLDVADGGAISVSTEAQNIDLPGLTFAIAAEGELIIGDILNLQGSFYFGINAEMIELRAQATMNTILGDFAVSGEVRIIYDLGLVGSFQLGLSSNVFGNSLFAFSGTFQLELNTTSVEQTITVLDVRDDGTVAGLKEGTIAAYTLRVAVAGELQIAGFVSFVGSAGLSISPDGFEAYLNMKVDLGIFGYLRVIGNAKIANENGEVFFAMRIRATFAFGIGDDFGVYGDIYAAVNTHSQNTYFGVGPSSFAFELVGQIKIVVINAEVTGRITYENGVFAMSFSGSLNFFNFVSMNVSGYVDSQGNFSVSGRVSFSINLFIIRVGGEFALSFSNSGFSLRVSGSVDIRNPLGFLFGPEWIEILSLSGEVAITSTSALISVTAKILFISIDVDIFISWDGVGARDIMKVEEGDTLDLGGSDQVLQVNDVEIFAGATMKNPGGKIGFVPNTGGAINIGNGSAGTGVTVDKAELNRIEDGTAGLVFGANGSSYDVQIGNLNFPGDTLNLRDPIIIYNNGGSGDTWISSVLNGNPDAYLQIFGSGNTTYISQDISMGSSIEIYDSVVLDSFHNPNGVLEFTAGTGGSGNIVLGTGSSRLDGNGDATDDFLVLSALGGGDVTINSVVGQLDAIDGLTITHADDVTFTKDVTIDGDLVIHATGDIVFQGDLTLLNGGSLIISGANSVSFNESQSVISLTGTSGGVPGDLTIVADNMQLPSSSAVATGAGFVVLQPRNVGRQIELASPVADPTVPALRLSVEELQLLGSGWQHLLIGYNDGNGLANDNTGPILIGGATRTDYTILSAASIYGASIHVRDYPDDNRVLRTLGPLDLVALGDVTIDNEMEVGSGAPENLVVVAEAGTIRQTESVSAMTGEVHYTALNNVYQSGDIYAGGGVVDVVGATGEIVMADGTLTHSEQALIGVGPAGGPMPQFVLLVPGSINYTAGTDIYLSILEAGTKIEVYAATHNGVGAIYDNLSLDVAGLDNNLIGGEAILRAANGIGLTTDAINTAVESLELLNDASGGIFFQETDSVEVISAVALLDVPSTDGRDGAIVIDSLAGLMTITGVVSAQGHVRMHVTLGSILANANISSLNKNISLLAFGDITASDTVDIRTTGAGTIDMEALTGSITLSTTSDVTTTDGDIRLLAGLNITVGGILSTTGSVSATALTGWIRDGDADGSLDILAYELRLFSFIGVGEVGSTVNPMETTVAILSGRAGTEGFNILESDQLIIGDTGATIQRVNSDASTVAVTDATQSDIVTTHNGPIVVRTINGNLSLFDGTAPQNDVAVHANGTGRILLEAMGIGTSIDFHADIISGSGEISILADLNVTSTGTADILSGGTGTIDVEARYGSITYSVTSDQRTGSGDIRFNAEINITLGGVTSTTGDVSGTAVTGWIRDGDSDGTVDIYANELRFWAEIGVGQLGAQVNPIETTVTTMSARAGVEGINILETDDLIINASDVTIQRVLPDTGLVAVTDEARVDVTTYNNGSIVVRTINGDMYLVGGADSSVRTYGPPIGEGNILLEAIGQGTSIEIFKNVISDSGDITILAAWDIISHETASIATNILGTIELEATKGSIDLSQGTDIESYNGDVRLYADNNVLLGGVIWTKLNVWIFANSGSVFDQVRDGSTDVIADKLVVSAGSGIGQKKNDFEFTVNELTIRTLEDSMYLMGNRALTLRDGISNQIYRVNPDASTQVRIQVSEGAGLDSADSALLELRRGDLMIVREASAPQGLRLILRDGGVVDARGGPGPDIATAQFELSASHFGTAANPVEVETSLLSGLLSGNLYLTNTGALEIGVLGNLSGLVSLNGNVEIETTGAILVDGLQAGGNVSLSAGSGKIRGGTLSHVLDISGASVFLSAENGLGESGMGSLDITATELVLQNRGLGSAYINLYGTTVLAGTDLAGPGSLFVRSDSGDLIISGVNTVYGGDATLQVKGLLSVTGDLIVSGQTRITAEGISGVGALIESKNSNVFLRSIGDIVFDSASQVLASNGSITTLSGSGVVSGLIQAGLRVSVATVSGLSGGGTLIAPMTRLVSMSGAHSGLTVYADAFASSAPGGSKLSVFDYLLDEDSRILLSGTFP